MAFVNTRDTIGDQATVDGLVENSLTELKEDGIGILGPYALYNNNGLRLVDFPNITTISSYALHSCKFLETIILGVNGSSSVHLKTNALAAYDQTALQSLLIGCPSVATSDARSPLPSMSPLAQGKGAIYVPEELVEAYKNNSIWSAYIIAKLADYPLSSFDTIPYNWSEIHNSITDGTYDNYKIGDVKSFTMKNGVTVSMVLMGKNVDIKSEGGTAAFTWICRGIFAMHKFHDTNNLSGGWANCDLRNWLNTDVLSNIPDEVNEHIVAVKKYYRTKVPSDETLVSSDKLWVPSHKEAGLTNSGRKETNGPTYQWTVNDRTSKQKMDDSNVFQAWWLRTEYASGGYIDTISNAGSEVTSGLSYMAPTRELGVVFGFCTD